MTKKKVPAAKIRSALDRDPDFRTLKMCVKYLNTVSSRRMIRPTLIYLWDRFVVNAK
jgi:hypothetical protein